MSGIVNTFWQHLLRGALISLIVIVLSLGLAPLTCIRSQPATGRALVIIPFAELLKRPVEVRADLKGVHPRLFFTAADITSLRDKAKGANRDLWQATIKDIQTLDREVPDPNDEDLYKSGLDNRKPGSVSQYELAFQITQTSLAFVVEQDERYLKAAKEWALAACEMPIWGYTYNKPNVDLPPAHLLYAIAFAYDVLYDKLSPTEKITVRDKLLKQGRLMYDYFKYRPGKRYTYTQNHTWIPMAGLAIAAYAIMDEVDEAKEWAQLSRAIFDRTTLAFGTDGFFYESFHYFGFAFRWMIRYFDAHWAVTGENLYAPMKSKFDGMKYFVMHSVLPDGKNVFDFADVGDGALNRNGISKRESLYSEYDILYRFAAVYTDSEAQAVGDYLRTKTDLETREPMWAFLSRNASVKPAPLSRIPLTHHFKDNDTVFWRSGWTEDATAFAFRCAPPEGHHAAGLAPQISDWRQNTGHAHPDANSFIIWAKGKYLTGDTGYLGIKQTDDHNTILVNKSGQEKDGVYEMFKEVANDRLNKIRLVEVDAAANHFYARGEASSGYYTDLGIRRFERHFMFFPRGFFVVWDELETEKPSIFTFLLNADRQIKTNDTYADLINGDTALRVFRIAPENARTEIVDQMVRARGLPGSVDKGDLEKRGVQLRIATQEAVKAGGFVHVLVPFKTAEPTPTVSSDGKEITIRFPNGDTSIVCLGNGCSGKGRIVVSSIVDGQPVRPMTWQAN